MSATKIFILLTAFCSVALAESLPSARFDTFSEVYKVGAPVNLTGQASLDSEQNLLVELGGELVVYDPGGREISRTKLGEAITVAKPAPKSEEIVVFLGDSGEHYQLVSSQVDAQTDEDSQAATEQLAQMKERIGRFESDFKYAVSEWKIGYENFTKAKRVLFLKNNPEVVRTVEDEDLIKEDNPESLHESTEDLAEAQKQRDERFAEQIKIYRSDAIDQFSEYGNAQQEMAIETQNSVRLEVLQFKKDKSLNRQYALNKNILGLDISQLRALACDNSGNFYGITAQNQLAVFGYDGRLSQVIENSGKLKLAAVRKILVDSNRNLYLVAANRIVPLRSDLDSPAVVNTSYYRYLMLRNSAEYDYNEDFMYIKDTTIQGTIFVDLDLNKLLELDVLLSEAAIIIDKQTREAHLLDKDGVLKAEFIVGSELAPVFTDLNQAMTGIHLDLVHYYGQKDNLVNIDFMGKEVNICLGRDFIVIEFDEYPTPQESEAETLK